MDRINLLIASSDRHLANFIEAATLDACYGQAIVESFRTRRVDEFIRLGSGDGFHLIVVAAEQLLAEPSRRSAWVPAAEIVRAVGDVRSRGRSPVIALIMSPEQEMPLLEAGADGVLRFPFTSDALKAEVRRLLALTEPVPEAEASSRWSLGGALRRGLHLLKSA